MLHALLVAVVAAAPECSLEEHGVDFDEGDIQPLGSGFRNATSAGDCCSQCAAVAGCLYYSYSGSNSQEGGVAPAQGRRHSPRHTAPSPVFPPHNCWLKSSFGARVKKGGRTSGAVGPLPPTPAPAPPWPDACNGAAGCPLGAGRCAWCDVSAPVAARVAALVAALTLAEKVVQISTFTPGTVPGAPRVGLPPFSYHSEGLHGVRCAGPKTLGLVATLFPQTTAMAAAANVSLVRDMAAAMRTEARALWNVYVRRSSGPDASVRAPFANGAGLFYWSPTMNLGRDPRWGRFQESISEDPWLNGNYAAAFVEAFQARNATVAAAGRSGELAIAATCKHFVGYSVETNRFGSNAIVPLQDLHQTYLPPFKRCVESGRPAQVMCSYNAINGTPACLHPLLADPLRSAWGFDGLIVSDQDTIKDAFEQMTSSRAFSTFNQSQATISARALAAGCDQNDGGTYAASVGDALAQGLVAEADVDVALGRILTQRFRLGIFDPPSSSPYASIGVDALNSPAHAALALRAAKESIALLANFGGNSGGGGTTTPTPTPTLPLVAPMPASIAVVGPMANLTMNMMGSKTDYSAENIVSYLAGISARAARAGVATVRYAQGVDVAGKQAAGGGTKAAAAAAAQSAVTVVCVGIDGSIEHEGADRATIGLPGGQLAFLQAVVGAAAGAVVVVLSNGGPLAVDWLRNASRGGGPVGAVVEAFEGGQGAGTALAAVLFGDTNPSGVLPFTVYPEGYVEEVQLTDMSMAAAGVGRTYRFYTGEPLWHFGAGLSYSNFTTAWQQPSPPPRQQPQQQQQQQQQPPHRKQQEQQQYSGSRTMSPAAAANATFTVEVTNHGPRDGAKAVLAFAHTNGTGGSPLKSLFGMQKVFLAIGESRTLAFSTGAEDVAWLCPFCSVDAAGRRAIRPGSFVVTVGGDAGAPRAGGGAVASIAVELTGEALDLPLF
jgi:beta-glucosidase-like glycosyl hydrolase